ncbi:WD repeat-containing protein 49-like [Lacerta agilis]|uniref:WD repeat-containing protein 49-like n=1 Tax=Lacerta agilis TaxID=80427 RepID=UPI001419FAFD|nr:WD repeat-containing protein 49-like [Lacerta agilis]
MVREVKNEVYCGNTLCWKCFHGSFCPLPEDLTINKIIFLLSRLERKKTAAVLAASGPRGYIAFWNIYGRGSLFAYFSSSKERSTVSDMAVDDKDFLLCAGDQLGFLYIWNIAEYAINGPEAKPPVLLHSWNTHNGSITR